MARVLPDGSDVMVLQLNETGPTRTNSGNLGSAGNWADFGSPISNAQGLLSDALYIPSAYLVNARNGSGGANDVLVTPNVSLSGWVFMRRNTNYFSEVFNKQYFVNGWSNPNLTFGFQTQNTNDGSIELYITLNGTLQVIRSGSNFPVPVGKWSHIGGTWDGSTLRLYINGILVNSSPFTGTIDYGTSGRGQWYTGGIPGTSVNQDSPIIVHDIRIANVTRPQSYFANIYYNGMFVNG